MSGRWYSVTPTSTTSATVTWDSQSTASTSTWMELPARPKLELLPDLPPQQYQGPMPARSSAFAKRRNGFQQLARLPNYRGKRTR